MPHTLWRPSLALALYRNRQAPSSRCVQLATIRQDGRPANRTVLFRGFLLDTHRLTFVVDRRSAKVEDVTRLPWAEACWYFPATHEQFRIGGATSLVGAAEADPALREVRGECWRELSDSARLSFAWPAPGEPRNARSPFPTDVPDRASPLPQFCLLVLDPREVDHLEINGNPQNRWNYRCDDLGRWSAVEVNP
jgi:PPOX class probable FMN-dependent enzyme